MCLPRSPLTPLPSPLQVLSLPVLPWLLFQKLTYQTRVGNRGRLRQGVGARGGPRLAECRGRWGAEARAVPWGPRQCILPSTALHICGAECLCAVSTEVKPG